MISKQAENYFRTRVFRKPSDRLIAITVNGNSMWPFLRHGQEVVVRRLMKDENYNIGDIVVIKVRSFFLIHRVLFKRKTKGGKRYQYFTKGDRRLVGDGWIDIENIVGIVQIGRLRVFNYLISGYSIVLGLFGRMLKRN